MRMSRYVVNLITLVLADALSTIFCKPIDSANVFHFMQAGLDFAQKHNIRLLIRNTGHESVFLLMLRNSILKCTQLPRKVHGLWRFGTLDSSSDRDRTIE